MKRRITAFAVCILMLFSLSSCNGQKKEIEFSYFSGNFNPFSLMNHTDLSATALTQAYILVKEPSRYDDSQADIAYHAYDKGIGIANITDERHSDENYVDYTIKIGKDIKFSNGDKVTSKDIAFSLYVYAHIDYVGWAKVGTTAIDGLKEYRYGNSLADEVTITDEQIEAELASPSELTKKYIRERIILPVLEDEYEWVTHLYTDEAYKGTEAEEAVKKYTEPEQLFAYFYALDGGYVPAEDKETLINDIADQYGHDYKTLAEIYASDLDELAGACASRALTEQALEKMGGNSVSDIRGIKIVDDSTLTLRINSLSETQLENALGVFVVPFSVYGKKCEYKDGAFSIDIESVLDPTLEPVGAGPCVFDGYKKGEGVTLSENKHYFREVDFERNVILKETGNSNVSQSDTYFTIYDERLIVSD